MGHTRHAATLSLIALALAASACTRDPQASADDGGINFKRNSEFQGPRLRVSLTLQDGTDVSVSTVEDAVQTRAAATPIPGHQARDWTFIKDTGGGIAVAYALASWDGNDPADYLMAGWWAQFPGQELPDLSFAGSEQYAIVDGPEIDPASPPELPLAGRATYTGPAGGLYRYRPGSDWGADEGASVVDEYEGAVTLEADFARATISGCIGCVGDLVTRRAHFGIFLGAEIRDLQAIAAGYELHLNETALNPDGTFEASGVTVRHPERAVTGSAGGWGGSVSSRPDGSGHPRLAAGFSHASFEEGDGSEGYFFGTFLGLSEDFRASGE